MGGWFGVGRACDRRNPNKCHVRFSCIKKVSIMYYHSWSFVPKHTDSMALHESVRQWLFSVGWFSSDLTLQ